MLGSVGAPETGHSQSVPPEHVAVHLRLDGPDLDRKLTALRAMATQTAGTATDDPTFRAAIAEEAFVELVPSEVERPSLTV